MTRATKRQATRERIAQAASTLFLKRGFDAVTMDEIAELAGVSRRTLFRYFPTKVELVFPEHERRLGLFQSVLADAQELPARLRVQRALLGLVQDCQDSSEHLLSQAQIIGEHPVLVAAELSRDAQWEAAMAQTLAAEMPTLRAQMLAGALGGLMRAVIRAWVASDCSLPLSELAEQAQALIDLESQP